MRGIRMIDVISVNETSAVNMLDIEDLDPNLDRVWVESSIDTDQCAEQTLKSIAKLQREYERMQTVCEQQISYYKTHMQWYERSYQYERSRLESMLANYFEQVEPKETKTQATYKLPSGKLIKKFEKPQIVPDKDKLKKVLLGTEFVELEPQLKWNEYKKTLSIVESSGVVVNSYGEIVEGVSVEIKPAEFKVEV